MLFSLEICRSGQNAPWTARTIYKKHPHYLSQLPLVRFSFSFLSPISTNPTSGSSHTFSSICMEFLLSFSSEFLLDLSLPSSRTHFPLSLFVGPHCLGLFHICLSSFSSLNTHKPNWHARCPFGRNCSRPLQFSGTHYVHTLSAR